MSLGQLAGAYGAADEPARGRPTLSPVPAPDAALGADSLAAAAIVTGPQTRLAYLDVEPQPAAVPRARRYAREALGGWGLADAADDAELIISELVTNAVTSTAGLPFEAQVGLLLAADHTWLALLVWDASSGLPVRRPPDAGASAGRGLQIVEALSARWGSCADRGGKVVWALLALESPPG
jgi:anti-sigma regulatory factor (Ser/Thr protein kinase)